MVKLKRRQFMKFSSLGALSLFAGAGVLGSSYLKASKLSLRPPGALKEDEFLASCIKCGQCVQVCPYHTLELFDILEGYGVGTPYVDATNRGCYLCEAFPCVLACPTGSLSHNLNKQNEVEMGVAVVVSLDKCLGVNQKKVDKKSISNIYKHKNTNPQEQELIKKVEAFEGKDCTICADTCPLPNPLDAISMVDGLNGGKKPEILDACVGCGVCAELCPTQVIRIEPRKNYKEYYNNA